MSEELPQPALVDVRDLGLILELLRHTGLLMDAIDRDPELEGAWTRLCRACGDGWRDMDNDP